jgi:hypothetical protein
MREEYDFEDSAPNPYSKQEAAKEEGQAVAQGQPEAQEPAGELTD